MQQRHAALDRPGTLCGQIVRKVEDISAPFNWNLGSRRFGNRDLRSVITMVRAMRDFLDARRHFDSGPTGHRAIRMAMVMRDTLRRRGIRCAGRRGILGGVKGYAHVIYSRASRLHRRGRQRHGFSMHGRGQRATLIRDASGESIDRGASGSGKLIVRAGHMRSMHRDRNEREQEGGESADFEHFEAATDQGAAQIGDAGNLFCDGLGFGAGHRRAGRDVEFPGDWSSWHARFL